MLDRQGELEANPAGRARAAAIQSAWFNYFGFSELEARLFHSIETLDKKATPLDTKNFHSNGPNYDPSNTSVLVDGPFCTDRFDTVPALSMYSF